MIRIDENFIRIIDSFKSVGFDDLSLYTHNLSRVKGSITISEDVGTISLSYFIKDGSLTVQHVGRTGSSYTIYEQSRVDASTLPVYTRVAMEHCVAYLKEYQDRIMETLYHLEKSLHDQDMSMVTERDEGGVRLRGDQR
jgi:hypothetical protein